MVILNLKSYENFEFGQNYKIEFIYFIIIELSYIFIKEFTENPS